MEPQIRLGVPAAPGEMVSVVTQLLPLLSTRNDPHAVLSICRLHICFRTSTPSHLLTYKEESPYSTAGFNEYDISHTQLLTSPLGNM